MTSDIQLMFPLFYGNEGGRGTEFLPATAVKSSLTAEEINLPQKS